MNIDLDGQGAFLSVFALICLHETSYRPSSLAKNSEKALEPD